MSDVKSIMIEFMNSLIKDNKYNVQLISKTESAHKYSVDKLTNNVVAESFFSPLFSSGRIPHDSLIICVPYFDSPYMTLVYTAVKRQETKLIALFKVIVSFTAIPIDSYKQYGLAIKTSNQGTVLSLGKTLINLNRGIASCNLNSFALFFEYLKSLNSISSINKSDKCISVRCSDVDSTVAQVRKLRNVMWYCFGNSVNFHLLRSRDYSVVILLVFKISKDFKFVPLGTIEIAD